MAIDLDESGDLSEEHERYEWLRATIVEMQRQQRENPALREDAVTGKTDASWPDRAAGIFADSPFFEESVHHGLEWRNANRPTEDGE